MSMMPDKAVSAIRDIAHEWAARLNTEDLTHGDKEAFAAWLRASPIHVREYLHVEALRETVHSALAGDTTDVRQLLEEPPSNVVALQTDAVPEPAQGAAPNLGKPALSARLPLGWVGRTLSLAAMVLLALGATFALLVPEVFERHIYATGIGELRHIELPDGSSIELNTRSRVRIAFDARRRDIELQEGEVFFTVAKDPERPFRVLSGAAQVQALGTQFSVYRMAERTVVTVLEGKVATMPHARGTALGPQGPDSAASGADSKIPENPAPSAAAPSAVRDDATLFASPAPLVLSAGHQLVVDARPGTNKLALEPQRVDAHRLTAWRERRLIFENEPLANVIAEFNRYNRQQLLIEDPELGAQGISGVFDPDKPQGLLLFLSRKGGVRAIEVSDTTLLLTR